MRTQAPNKLPQPLLRLVTSHWSSLNVDGIEYSTPKLICRNGGLHHGKHRSRNQSLAVADILEVSPRPPVSITTFAKERVPRHGTGWKQKNEVYYGKHHGTRDDSTSRFHSEICLGIFKSVGSSAFVLMLQMPSKGVPNICFGSTLSRISHPGSSRLASSAVTWDSVVRVLSQAFQQLQKIYGPYHPHPLHRAVVGELLCVALAEHGVVAQYPPNWNPKRHQVNNNSVALKDLWGSPCDHHGKYGAQYIMSFFVLERDHDGTCWTRISLEELESGL